MQFIDLKAQYQILAHDIQRRMNQVLEHGIFIMGPEVKELEDRLANFAEVKHCISVGNGTDALLIAMMALDIKPGDEVITTPFTFIAIAEMILLLGAKPVFVDIDDRTYNIDATKIENAITSKTKAIAPVNLYGQCADYDAINSIAKKYNLPVIEDAAQSFGATYKGQRSCGLSTIACTSFFPAKPLGCYGDGGACFTDNDELADKMRKIRNHGQGSRYCHDVLGMNSRLDSLQAAVLLAKLNVFEKEIQLRQEKAKHYNQLLKDQTDVRLPYIADYNTSVYAQYTVLVENRDEIQSVLAKEGIPTAIHYPTLVSHQPLFKKLNGQDFTFEVAEFCSERVLSLPFHPYLQDDAIKLITDLVPLSRLRERVG